MAARPTWQTEELDEEWIDEDDEQEDQHDAPAATSSRDAHTTSDLSFTQPLGSFVSNEDANNSHESRVSAGSAGTIVIHESQLEDEAPLLPQTPLRGKNIMSNDLFSPMALEKMFEPPSPPSIVPPSTLPRTSAPAVPSRLSQMYIPSETDSTVDSDGFTNGHTSEHSLGMDEAAEGEGENKYQFTFAAPRTGSSSHTSNLRPNAQSTPLPPHTPMQAPGDMLQPPLTDPRLRLFQFQYDTFTREHLSAMVDSIAVNTPSGGSGTAGSKDTTPAASSLASEHSISRLRSAKRLKLSPASDFSEDGDGAAVIIRPQNRRDYVGESQSLMDKIRQARDFSTISTQGVTATPASVRQSEREEEGQGKDRTWDISVMLHVECIFTLGSLEEMSFLAVPASRVPSEGSSAWTTTSSKNAGYSSLAIREQAANLMNQIRTDVKSHKRLFSVDSDGSMVRNDSRSYQNAAQPEQGLHEETITEGDTEIIDVEDVEPEPARRHSSSQRPTIPALAVSSRHDGPDDSAQDLANGLARVSLTGASAAAALAQFPAPPAFPSGPAAPVGTNGRPAYLSPHAGTPNYPSGSLNGGRKEDLTRFVSSSTASGGTITSGSAASFVKHQGPKHITHITPDDLPPLPDRVGKMVLDRRTMTWVKATSVRVEGPPPTGTMKTDGSNESEDPFRDFESLRDDEAGADESADVEQDVVDDGRVDMSLDEHRVPIAEDSEPEDAEEAELISFSFDASADPVTVNGMDSTVDSQDESDDDQDTVTSGNYASINLVDDSLMDTNDSPHTGVQQVQQEPALQDTPPHMLAPSPDALTTPQPASRASAAPAPTPTIRSALKSTSVTPVSALKNPSRGRLQTPANKLGHRRSVSFSDGKREGPIAGIGRDMPTPDGSLDSDSDAPSAGLVSGPSTALVPSARSKRIADMLEDLEDTCEWYLHDPPRLL